jgi:predicted GNAT family acetyltransferase
MQNLITEIALGKQLTNADLETINEYRLLRLQRPNAWDHAINNHFHDRTFFLVRDDGVLVSFGTLRSLQIYIDGKQVEVMGVQTIVSIIQSKGYGKILMQEMIKYADEHSLTLLGFCDPHNRDFYLKSGVEVFPEKGANFIYINELSEERTQPGDVIYYSASGNEVKEAILADKKIKHFIPHW